MPDIPWLLIAILVVLIVLGLVMIVITKKNKRPPDYYALFVIGICWLPLGIPLKNYAFSVMGLVFMIVGLVHRDKWKENRRTWKSLTKEEKSMKMVIMAVLGLLLLAGIGAFVLVEKGVINF